PARGGARGSRGGGRRPGVGGEDDRRARVRDRDATAAGARGRDRGAGAHGRLQQLAEQWRRSRTDAKWTRLPELLQDGEAEMFDETGKRRKLIVFSEHRGTVNYPTARIPTPL